MLWHYVSGDSLLSSNKWQLNFVVVTNKKLEDE